MVGIDGSGSVGGCILLDDPAYKHRPRLCLLTSHHVVQPHTMQSNPSAFKQALTLQHKTSSLSRMSMMRSPSMKDYNNTVAYLEDNISRDGITLAKMLHRNQNSEEFHTPQDIRNYNKTKEQLNGARKQLDLLRSQEHPIGKVIASSGIRVEEFQEGVEKIKRRMDWAIVEIDDEPRFNPVSAPEVRNISSANQDKPRDGPYEPPDLPSVVIETANLRLGQWVCMRGRTSGYTTGTVNLIDVDMSPINLDINVGPYTETIIISTRSGEKFSTAGDSGSFIYDRMGRVVAMQVSERYPKDHKREHFTGVLPIRAIFLDIARQTKARPRLCSEEAYNQLNFGA